MNGARVALIEAGSPGLNIYSHVAMGRGVPLLATVVRDAGYDVAAFVEDLAGKECTDWEYVRTASVIGFSAITCTMPRTAELIARARLENPGAAIVLGGPEPTCDPDRSFAIGADFVLKGEAEHTFPRLLDILTGRSAGRFGEIPGLVWRAEDGVHAGPPHEQLSKDDLDALPLVDRSLIAGVNPDATASVWRTRGCPEHCDFCEVCEIYARCVRRSDDRTLDELMGAQEQGFPTAFLIDDNAAANKPAFKEFLRKTAERGYARMLVAQVRADAALTKEGKVDRELLRLLKKAASVTIVCIGVESASDENLEAIHKRIDAGRMARALKAMRRAGLVVHGMFIALNSDTRQTIRRNGAFARKYVSSLQYLAETPLPGTKRTAEHESQGALLFPELPDLRFYDGMHVVLRPTLMAADEMQQRIAREYRRFYSWGRIVRSALAGTFLRFRRTTAAQRAYLAQLSGGARLRKWLRFQVEYKYAPVSFLYIGRRRVREILKAPDYGAFLERLREIGDSGVGDKAL